MLDTAFARGLRLSLWAEHLGVLRYANTGWPAPAALPLPKPMVTPREEGLRALLTPVDWRQLETDEAAGTHGADELRELEDPLAGIALLERRAAENLDRLRRGQPLEGHLFPYLLYEEAQKCGLALDRSCGLLDPLRSTQEGITLRHLQRYT